MRVANGITPGVGVAVTEETDVRLGGVVGLGVGWGVGSSEAVAIKVGTSATALGAGAAVAGSLERLHAARSSVGPRRTSSMRRVLPALRIPVVLTGLVWRPLGLLGEGSNRHTEKAPVRAGAFVCRFRLA
jgi:hypothetical protein